MVAGSILPVTIHKNKLYFLFGKENELADTPGYSDFGGGLEKNETPYDTALREGSEELTGFLGDSNQIKNHIEKHGGVYKIQHNTYHMHIFFLEYDENLIKHYNDNHAFLWSRLNKKFLNNTKLFEKSEIAWFSQDDMIKRKSEFRNFYQEIVDKLNAEIPNIRRFLKKKVPKFSKKNVTQKQRGGM
jgi:hypothetical protein